MKCLLAPGVVLLTRSVYRFERAVKFVKRGPYALDRLLQTRGNLGAGLTLKMTREL